MSSLRVLSENSASMLHHATEQRVRIAGDASFHQREWLKRGHQLGDAHVGVCPFDASFIALPRQLGELRPRASEELHLLALYLLNPIEQYFRLRHLMNRFIALPSRRLKLRAQLGKLLMQDVVTHPTHTIDRHGHKLTRPRHLQCVQGLPIVHRSVSLIIARTARYPACWQLSITTTTR